MLRLIRSDMFSMLSTLDLTELGVENNVRWWKRNQSWLCCDCSTPEDVKHGQFPDESEKKKCT
jgi:hypothetical protein